MNSLNNFFPKSKKISIEKFITNAMYDKNYGYYSKKIPFGKDGDFITAPDISSLFSEMLALWIISFWEHLKKPKILNVVELGPGNGKMSSDLLKVFRKFPKFLYSCNIYLYEKSEYLTKLQKNNKNSNQAKKFHPKRNYIPSNRFNISIPTQNFEYQFLFLK